MNDIHRYYEILGVEPGASQAEVKQAYRTLAKTWHPDCFPDDPLMKQKAEEEIKKINYAYQQVKSYQFTDAIASPNPTCQTRVYSDSANAETHYNRGMENVQNLKYEEAIEEFSKAIRIDPKYIEAYEQRGLACAKLGYEYRAASDLGNASRLKRTQRKTAAQTLPPQKERSQSKPQPKPESEPKPPTSAPTDVASPWKCVSTLRGHSDVVATVAISRDGRTLASGSFDKTIKLWNLGTGRLIHTLNGHSERVLCVAISHNGMTLASGSVDKTIKLWNLGTGKLIRTLGSLFSGHSDKVYSVAFSPD